jgi:hypothetical protein
MRGRRSIRTVASLLIEWELPVHIPINCVAAVSGVERLCVVSSQTEIVNILRESVDVVVLLRDVSLGQSMLRHMVKELASTMLVTTSIN